MVRVWSKWGMALKQAVLGESKGHRAFWGVGSGAGKSE